MYAYRSGDPTCCQGAEVALTWDATVARAAPRQPQSAVNMSRGASTTLMALQARVPHRGVLVSPKPLYTPCSQNRQSLAGPHAANAGFSYLRPIAHCF